MVWRIAPVLLLASTVAAAAAPLVPPSDQAGRERYRFTPSPLDRFMGRRDYERVLGEMRLADGAGVELLDYTVESGATEFTLPELKTYAVIDLLR